MIRLAVLGLWHEANSFSPYLVDDAYFEAVGVLRGAELVARHKTGTTTVSGYLAAASEHPDVELVPLVMTSLIPAGPITNEALRTRADELIDALELNGPYDGVLACLHGAAVSEEILDVDGYLLRRFRDVVGPDVPIGVSLDLHANISAEMCECADVLNTYRTNPHVDARETAVEVAELIIGAARGEIRPTLAFEPVPAAINILCQNTDESPMRDIIDDVRAVMREPGVLSATVAEGFPYADVPEMGMSVVVVTDNDPTAAKKHARALAGRVWQRRDEFDTTAASAAEALSLAASAPQGPVLLLDVGDNIGGGSPGDSVALLNAAREVGFADLLTIIHDHTAAARCDDAGIGARVELTFGAHSDLRTGPPVSATVTVLALHDGLHRATGPVHAGMRNFDGGRTAAVKLDSGQTVILTSKRVMPLSIETLATVGLTPASFKAIVAKGVHSPLAGYLPHVADVIRVDTPGVTSADLSRFTYHHRYRHLFPFETDARYP